MFQSLARVRPASILFEPRPVKIKFNPEELVKLFEVIVQQSIGECADLNLLKSMMPHAVSATKTGEHTTVIDVDPIIERIKWRVKMAAKFGVTLEAFRDERIDANSKTDDIAILRALSDMSKGEVIDRLDGIQCGVAEGLDVTKEMKSIVVSFVLPRPSDYECSEKALSQILDRLNVGKCARQIRRWEKFIETCGKKGSPPPSGYSLQTRLTVASATAWAQSYAALEKSKLSTRTYLNEATATRDPRPARRK